MALRDQPYLPLYVMDFVTDEKLEQCSAESTGVYIRLMCYMHKSIPYGTVTLNQKCMDGGDAVTGFAKMLSRPMPYDISVIERSLRELIEMGVLTLEGDVLLQKRMVRDGELSETRAAAAKQRGSKASAKSEQNSSKRPAKSQQNTENENEYENESEDDSENDRAGDRAGDRASSSLQRKAVEERFDLFWAAYPKKTGKGYARKIFLKIAPSKELFERMMAALEKAKRCEQWVKDRGQYIPYPSTWLNQERWDDDYGPTPAPGPGQPPEDFDPENPYQGWGEDDG